MCEHLMVVVVVCVGDGEGVGGCVGWWMLVSANLSKATRRACRHAPMVELCFKLIVRGGKRRWRTARIWSHHHFLLLLGVIFVQARCYCGLHLLLFTRTLQERKRDYFWPLTMDWLV